ncbi:MAG: hypothetical protein QOH14_4128 [Pseudonocardiales bacterium]|jgi:hypothetical protein|nr:hypothetical protein [Pseudonocardiales bacterium]
MAEDPTAMKFPRFDQKSRDEVYWQTVENIFTERGYTLKDALRHFPSYAMRRDIPRFLSHYELFKQIIDLPGCVVELGIWRGASFFTWHALMETFCPFDRSRKIFGFDSFEGLQQFAEEDGNTDRQVQKNVGGYTATAAEVRRMVEAHNADNMIAGTQRAVLIEGDIFKTIPEFLKEHPGLKISLLHFDLDLYGPTKFALEQLYPLVVEGGVVCLDEYGLIPWQGETRAVDEFFVHRPNKPVIRKHPFAQTPHGYFIKRD